MKLLAIGDVCGFVGCRKVMETLPRFKKENRIDLVVVNGENSADGNGITRESARMLFAAGADVITGGNHSLRRKAVYEELDANAFLLRPDNLPDAPAGKGFCLVDLGYTSVAVLNLCGVFGMEKAKASSPFQKAEERIAEARAAGAKIIVVDFHAEATSEKRALGLYLDGRVSVFFGTHTHIQTADEKILPGGTGYLTDLGMTGPIASVLGVKSETIIARFKDGAQDKFEWADGECEMDACLFEIDRDTGRTVGIERFIL